jgi:hypothetical protein
MVRVIRTCVSVALISSFCFSVGYCVPCQTSTCSIVTKTIVGTECREFSPRKTWTGWSVNPLGGSQTTSWTIKVYDNPGCIAACTTNPVGLSKEAIQGTRDTRLVDYPWYINCTGGSA